MRRSEWGRGAPPLPLASAVVAAAPAPKGVGGTSGRRTRRRSKGFRVLAPFLRGDGGSLGSVWWSC